MYELKQQLNGEWAVLLNGIEAAVFADYLDAAIFAADAAEGSCGELLR